MIASTYGQRKGRLLYEQARADACGFRRPAVRPTKPLCLIETMEWARRVPRSARLAQGFPHTKDFAHGVKQLRAQRAELRKHHPDPLRRTILDALERILSNREDLRKAARREAHAHWRPKFSVRWGSGKPQVYNSLQLINGRYYGKRDVAIPAAWLLARIGGDANVANRVRQADPRARILATPHWVDPVHGEFVNYAATGIWNRPRQW
jgi:hypothetical protein